MKDFFLAALPYICIGIAIALFVVNHGMIKKGKNNFMTEGMCLGLCVGTALGGNGMIYGMVLGMVVGMFIEK
ncbi:MAG: hypothetical protein E7456_03120 [Ruminococcaceae bacterium]|nr:hypothetical protein [Oscillospiraceae bacterium]